jgi:hypothetical protein
MAVQGSTAPLALAVVGSSWASCCAACCGLQAANQPQTARHLRCARATEFLEFVERELGAAAAAAGVLCVPSAGFDSVPADWGVMLARRAFLPPAVKHIRSEDDRQTGAWLDMVVCASGIQLQGTPSCGQFDPCSLLHVLHGLRLWQAHTAFYFRM